MGVVFNDPDVELDDIYWYNTLAIAMADSLTEHEGLISVETIKLHDTDKELKTYSCYVELHRTGFNRPTDNLRENFLRVPTETPVIAIQLE